MSSEFCTCTPDPSTPAPRQAYSKYYNDNGCIEGEPLREEQIEDEENRRLHRGDMLSP